MDAFGRIGKKLNCISKGSVLPESPVLERLEERLLLDADPMGHAIARFSGVVDETGYGPQIHVELTPEDFAPTRINATCIGLYVHASDGSALDPALVGVMNVQGQAVIPRYSTTDLPGVSDSLTLYELPYGEYTLTVQGEGGSVGGYLLDVFLVGDADGDGDVDRTDTQAIYGIYGSREGDGRYLPEADANLDGMITSFDVAQHVRNIGVITPISVLSLTGALEPAPTATDEAGIPLTNDPSVSIVGSTAPGVTLDLDTDQDGYDDGTTTAAADGSYELALTLVEGLNQLQVRATDGFGQRCDVLLPIVLDSVAPVVAFSLSSATDSEPMGDDQTTFEIVDLEGTTEPGLLVQLYRDGDLSTPVAEVVADATGSFVFSGIALDEGENPFTVAAMDHAGNVGQSARTIVRGPTDVVLLEGTEFTVEHRVDVVIPAEASSLQIAYEDLQFDMTADFINDAFEVALLDSSGRTVGAHDQQ